MAFSNQSSCIITDSKGNLHTFLWSNRGIEEIFFDKALGKTEKRTIVANCSEEFDVVIDNNDMLHLAYQLNNGKIELVSSRNGVWNREELVNQLNSKALNLGIKLVKGKPHIFYCVLDESNNRGYQAYHSMKEDSQWENNSFVEISVIDILNPLSIVKHGNELVVGYYNLIDNIEQLFIKKYSLESKEWGESTRLTANPTKKLYLDMMADGNDLHITYTEQFNGNYIVKYQKHIINEGRKVSEHILSNPSNVIYPTLVIFDNKLWIVWSENENIMSSYTEDIGMEWTEPYLWTESKKDIFVRYRFGTNDNSIKKTYRLNHSFGKQYPNITFMGFGDANNAVKVPLKYEKKEKVTYSDKEVIEYKVDNEDIAVSSDNIKEKPKVEVKDQEKEKKNKNINNNNSNRYDTWNARDFKKSIRRKEKSHDDNDIEEVKEDINKLHKEIKEINKAINQLSELYKDLYKDVDDVDKSDVEDKLVKIEKRVDDIETYLTRRRRGSLFSR